MQGGLTREEEAVAGQVLLPAVDEMQEVPGQVHHDVIIWNNRISVRHVASQHQHSFQWNRDSSQGLGLQLEG